MSIQIREISAEETWEIRHRVMWPNKSLEYVKLKKDEVGIHLALFQDDDLISVISAFVENGEAQFRKFATEIHEQGRGYGTQLLAYMMDYLSTQKINRIWCNARVDKTNFYQRFGLVETEEFFSRGEIHYVIMEKRIGEV